MYKSPLTFLPLLVIALAACQPVQTIQPTASATPHSAKTFTPFPPTLAHDKTQSLLKPSTSTPPPPSTPSPVSNSIDLCSPLEDISLEHIADIIYNPFHPPALGSDDPHQGIDLAELDPQGRLALEGREVQAVLAGRVSTVIEDRFPYGNAILIESPLMDQPVSWVETLNLPTPAPTLGPHPALTCPQPSQPYRLEAGQRSLYLLYAHLKDPPAFKPGAAVACGQPIAAVGMSGNALNPHLHLEARVGPASVRFGGLAHYTSSASPDEMAAYCAWRVSGLFQLIDPLELMSLTIEPR